MNALVDTNFLIRLRQPGTPLCQTCEGALLLLLGRGDTLYLCAQAVLSVLNDALITVPTGHTKWPNRSRFR
jgi:hypothetical protein